jgi:D-alanyl-D-alanine dipeptidase
MLEPIWRDPIDAVEGALYEEYILKHPSYKTLLLRQRVANNLYLAAESLPNHYKLILRAAHRPLTVQTEELQTLIDNYLKDHPYAQYVYAVEFARLHVSDPSVVLAPHCCGAAVDVGMFDNRINQLVDFGCKVNTNSEIACIYSKHLTPEQLSNRMILLEAMLAANFAPCFTEWWHYSYGDTTWAYFYEQPKSLYGIINSNMYEIL